MPGGMASELARARAALAPTVAPRSLPCRETERDVVSSFVRRAVQAGASLLMSALCH